jgi:hypothetical protein
MKTINSRTMRWEEHVECSEMQRRVYRVVAGKTEGGKKRPFGRTRRRWENNFKNGF